LSSGPAVISVGPVLICGQNISISDIVIDGAFLRSGKMINKLGEEKTINQIASLLAAAKPSEAPIQVQGTWGSFGALLTAWLSRQLKRPILHIRPHIDDADRAVDDLRTFGAENVEHLPAWEGDEELADATDEIRAERLKLTQKLSAISENQQSPIISTSVQALCQPIPQPELIREKSLKLITGGTVSPENIIAWLSDNAFERVDRIDLPGQFARRGGIIDIFAPLLSADLNKKDNSPDSQSHDVQPVRIEFFGDEIESIRRIDLDSQLSTAQIKSLEIVSTICGTGQQATELFLNVLPKNTLIIMDEPTDLQDVAGVFIERSLDSGRLYTWDDIYAATENFPQMHLWRFAPQADNEFISLDIKSVQQFQHKATSAWAGHKQGLQDLVEAAKKNTVYLYCERHAEIKRVRQIIEDEHGKVPPNFYLVPGFLNQGFAIESLKTILISHHELFGQFTVRRKQRPVRPSAPVDTLAELTPGDYVVHLSYGIGKFLGIKTIEQPEGKSEYLTIQYADGVKIQVSVTNIALVQKYIGTSPKRPKLSKPGSKKWQRQKEKVAESVEDLAAELLEVQAKREALGGIAYEEDSHYQAQFEESFAFTETADQLTAIEQIKSDMEKPVAMDRLLCGDVGYGKTELAMRAAFKAVENGRQVAVLVPTTVLCVQHARTFTERFADFPIEIEALNRFRTTKEAREIIERTQKGRVDILIGTHRLLSKDIGFKDIGLLIIDEEQRFGVEHKEKLKRLRVNIDVLTMTATPIPRTLHMSLMGLRDISSLSTPPLDRRSVVTSVCRYDKQQIRKAMLHEINREGQMFFLHNRVRSIDKKAYEISRLAPEAKIAVAHGQMPKQELEQAMIDFVTGKINTLVCTTIIESGLDIPNANTIIINDADRFGLAELHQLRGRVGRYKHRAYAYMLLPPSRPVSPIAARRLKAIEEYSHLGAGFRIALRDLEIRGAGNILGSQQSGHIQMVGYQLYCELLSQAVRRLKNQPAEKLPDATIEIGFDTFIPRNYIPIDRHRMDIYRKLAVARTAADLEQLRNELSDVYGPLPQQMQSLLEMAEIRIKASRAGIKSITISGNNLVFAVQQGKTLSVDELFDDFKGKASIINPKTVYLRLHKAYFEPDTLLAVLRKIFSKEPVQATVE